MRNSKCKNHSILVVLTVALLVFMVISGGCNGLSPINDDENQNNKKTETADPENNQPNNQSNGEKTLTVKLFFADNRLVAEDRPGRYGYVVPVLRSIPYTPDETIALQVTLKELIRGPLTTDPGDLFYTIPETTKLLNAEIENETATVNFSRELLIDNAGGTTGGRIFRESVIYTVTQCPSIKDLVVLVEGEPWCDGHYIWDTPLGEKDVAAP